MSKKKPEKKIIVFSCNWNGLSSLESAGIKRLSYSAAVYPIRLACLGRITPGIILKALRMEQMEYIWLAVQKGNASIILAIWQPGVFIKKPEPY